jgi:hypothetical protein
MCYDEEAEVVGPSAASTSHCRLPKVFVSLREEETAQIKQQAVLQQNCSVEKSHLFINIRLFILCIYSHEVILTSHTLHQESPHS